MATRSQVLVADHYPSAGVGVTLLTTPAGFTYLLKNLVVSNGSSSTQTLTMFYEPAGASAPLLIWEDSFGATQSKWYNPWWCFEAGDSLQVVVSGAKFDFYGSGAALID